MTSRRRPTLRLFLTLLILACATLPGLAHASRYRVDVIVFMDNGGVGGEQPVAAVSVADNAISPDNTAALSAAGITLLPASNFGLVSQWQYLRDNRRFDPVVKLSWIQTRASSGTAIKISAGQPVPLADGGQINAISGRIALYTGTLLHLDADLAYTFDGDTGKAVSYRLKEVRKVQFNQLHYLDSPRLGILARVSKVP